MAGQPPTRQIAKLNVAALARQHGPKAIQVLAKALDSDDQRLAIDAAVRLLDRGYGKPTQTIEQSDKSPETMTDAELLQAIKQSALAGADQARKDTDLLN